MKGANAANKKHLSMSARHPILLIKCGASIRAWMITQPVFKPLTFDCVAATMTGENILRLQSEAVGSFHVLAFRSMKSVLADICDLAAQVSSESLLYCFTSSYFLTLSEQLADIFLEGDLQWIDLKDTEFSASESEEDDDDDDSNAQGVVNDMTDIQELVSCMQGNTNDGRAESKGGKSTGSKKCNTRNSQVLHQVSVFVSCNKRSVISFQPNV